MNNILITGGSGYVGSRLTFNLLEKDKNINKIVNYDLSWFGDDHLPIENPKYVYLKEDIRNFTQFENALKKFNINIVIHLACISNDPSYLLNEKLSRSINYDCFEELVTKSKKNGVKKFIYASTSSVYGVSESPDVKEDHPLKPITDYNKYKGLCEPLLKKHLDKNFTGIIIRPATVCGYSEKMRFDLTVNILTNFAYHKKYIKVFGGKQFRPNIHIDDMCDLYKYLIDNDFNELNGETFNAGHQNLSVEAIAAETKKIVEKFTSSKIDIRFENSDDIRSYQINSDKIQNVMGFKFKKSIQDAVLDLCKSFKNNKINDSFNTKYSNLQVLKNFNLDEIL